MTLPNTVPRVHIVGRKNSGKTTLVCEIVNRLTAQNYKVATVKHTHHQHELDTPGKDSHKHRSSGAVAVGILSPSMTAVFIPRTTTSHSDDRSAGYAALDAAFVDCDLVVVEGDLNTTAPRIEVWRSIGCELPCAVTTPGITAIVTDDHVPFTGSTITVPDRATQTDNLITRPTACSPGNHDHEESALEAQVSSASIKDCLLLRRSDIEPVCNLVLELCGLGSSRTSRGT